MGQTLSNRILLTLSVIKSIFLCELTRWMLKSDLGHVRDFKEINGY
jgi:hypothetical protein